MAFPCNFSEHTHSEISVWSACAQVLAAREACKGGLCEERPHTGHSQFQPVLAGSAAATPQGTAEPVSKAGGASVKTCLRHGKKHGAERRREQQE